MMINMAGGAFANEVPCMTCLMDGVLTKSIRIYEGCEDDHYQCEQGHTFGMDWSRGAATEPQWPPAKELVEAFEK
jgi:hypothetical protein